MKPTIPEVWPMVIDYYGKPGNCAGGHLHIVLDDGNIDDDDVEFCLQSAKQNGDFDGVRLATKLLAMSKTQRRKLYAMPGKYGS